MKTITLDTEDFVNLLRGSFVPHELMDHKSIKELGVYTGGHHDKWTWSTHDIRKLTIDEIYDVYNLIKKW